MPAKKEDPFAPFADWHVVSHEDEWPKTQERKRPLTDAQKIVVQRNADRLSDRKKWQKLCDAFEFALEKIEDQKERTKKRNQFQIRLDHHQFEEDQCVFATNAFPCPVNFQGATFKGDAAFFDATFKGDAAFYGATFKGDAAFFGATFKGDAAFYGATFKGYAAFFDATFKGYATFFDATFEQNLFFTNLAQTPTTMFAADMVVVGSLYVNSHFRGPVDFERLEVNGTASFSGASFDRVPNFRDGKFDRPPEVANLVVPHAKDVLKRNHFWQTGWSPDRDIDENAEDEVGFKKKKHHYVARYRKLKAMALAANDHEKDGEFFSYEMLAKRGVETTTKAGLLFNTLYYRLSDFGQSFTKPLGWMFTSFIGFTLLNIWLIGFAMQPWDRLHLAWKYSLAHVVPLFTTLFRFGGKPEEFTSRYQTLLNGMDSKNIAVDWFIWFGHLQQFIGTILLFLFLLALRNKFRLK